MTTTSADIDLDATASSAALEVHGLSAGYGDTTILRDVSITVPRGEIVAVLGPNGAGKTTLLRTISGFLPATSGKISMLGADVTSEKPHRRFRRGMCHIPEGRGIFRSLSVRENLNLQASAGREAEAIERAASAFPVLADRLNQRAATLSGGQQQMLAMAAAYVRSPRLVLVDEASLGLAPLVVEEIFTFLHQLTTGEGASLLIVDQFVHRALGIASKAYVLRRGRVVFDGSAAELLDGDVFHRYIGDSVDP